MEEGESRLERIKRSGVLRVGYVEDNPPFGYRNNEDDLVGFDIDLIQRLAWDLRATLELVPCKPDDRGADVGRG